MMAPVRVVAAAAGLLWLFVTGFMVGRAFEISQQTAVYRGCIDLLRGAHDAGMVREPAIESDPAAVSP